MWRVEIRISCSLHSAQSICMKFGTKFGEMIIVEYSSDVII